MKLFKKSYGKDYFNTFGDLLKFNQIKEKISLIKSSKPRGKMLEIGCGRGDLLDKLQNYYDTTGIDVSEFAISGLRKRLKKTKLSVMNFERGTPKGMYDIIIAFDVLEHMWRPDRVIAKIRNILKKGGILIFSVPNNYGLFGKISTQVMNFFDRTHVSTLKRKDWLKIVKKNNFSFKVINQTFLGFSDADFSKHAAFNFIVVAEK